MLINTLFYIEAFHFSPTNTALTLPVAPPPPPPSAAEVMAILTSAIQFPPLLRNVKIILNEIQTQRVLVLVTSDLIDTGRV